MIIRALIVLGFLSHFNVLFGQQSPTTTQRGSIRIKVTDADDNKPVPFATVYFSKTTIGGYTDNSGNLEINNVPFGTYELAVSEISHKPYARSIIIKSQQPQYLSVKILPKTLKEVTITSKRDDKWNRQYTRFRRFFFGSEHFEECKISNPWLLEFKNQQGNFIATAEEPLKIENNYLGYNMEFRLKNCVFTADNFVINGDVRYEEKKGSDSLTSKWKANRERVYQGSQLHFFKALLDSTLDQEGFDVWSDLTISAGIVRNPSFLTNVGKSIQHVSLARRFNVTENGSYVLRVPRRLEIHYKVKRAKTTVYRNITYPISWLEVKNDTLIVSSDGFVQNPRNLTVMGAMSDLRVAEWLPLNYEYTGERKRMEMIAAPVETTSALLEKPYIQTDRNYYYQGETMWLKGYMSYSMPMLKDTLSQSVYVELADANNKVLIKKRYMIEDGKFNGDIVLDRKLPTGLYQLRSYTAWMLNYDPELIYTKTIDILGDREAVKVLTDYFVKQDTLPNISLKTDKETYVAREKINVTIDVFDSLAFRTISDLSISVTDVEQAVPLKHEKNILKDYSFIDFEKHDSTKVKFDIEYGIDFAGQFWMMKKPVQASITVFQENTKETFAMITDDSGKFYKSMLFKDTITFYLKAMSYNNKKGIVKMIESKVRSPKLDIDPLDIDLYSSDKPQHIISSLEGTKVLGEVTVKATKLEKPQPAVIHGKGDYTVTGDWINEHNFTDIFLAIVAKVPGLTYNYDPINPVFSFRGAMNLNAGIPPLILIDNVAAQALDVTAIPVRSLDRVDIVKFSGASAYGSRAAGGVIAIYTKKGSGEDVNPAGFDKTKLQEVKVFGYSSTSTFKGPEYQVASEDNKLDYRSTIHWSPFVTTDGKDPATVSFYAADIPTKYRIVVEGLTAGGVPVRAEKIIEVVKE